MSVMCPVSQIHVVSLLSKGETLRTHWGVRDARRPEDPEDAAARTEDETSVMTNSPERPYRRLTLSESDKKIAGVCGGIAEYFSVDPTLVRLVAVILALVGGSGLLIYLVAWLIMPKP